jgi:hypothetical protein
MHCVVVRVVSLKVLLVHHKHTRCLHLLLRTCMHTCNATALHSVIGTHTNMHARAASNSRCFLSQIPTNMHARVQQQQRQLLHCHPNRHNTSLFLH